MVRKEIFIPTVEGDVFAVYTSAETPDPVKPLVIMCHGMMMSGSLNPIRDEDMIPCVWIFVETDAAAAR